ncbi:hypothetical protein [Lapidilactobacillus bayanensis]|uniref:hypothetical protein n=1 Tax=Lapidilactobacillus bayanensis TaxID=2485998 RepID=UPI000F7A7598|nr:hypothetical protein [Lapidilactobacillus bayanensis]
MDKAKIYYPLDQLSYQLVLFFLIANTLLSIISINSMKADLRVGIEVMITIAVSLAGFLIAIRLQHYTPHWDLYTVILGVLQLGRIVILPGFHSNNARMLVQILLIVTAVYLSAAAWISHNHQRQRIEYINKTWSARKGGGLDNA